MAFSYQLLELIVSLLFTIYLSLHFADVYVDKRVVFRKNRFSSLRYIIIVLTVIKLDNFLNVFLYNWYVYLLLLY